MDNPTTAVTAHTRAIVDHLATLVDELEDADRDTIAELWQAHSQIADLLGILKSDLTSASLELPFDKDGLAVTHRGVLKRTWQHGRTTWDWPLVTSAFAGYVARTYDLPEDLAEQIVSDMATTVGDTKSKSWRVGELEKREVFSDAMRETDGGRWTVKLVAPPADDEETGSESPSESGP
jgi:hypothetical protein